MGSSKYGWIEYRQLVRYLLLLAFHLLFADRSSLGSPPSLPVHQLNFSTRSNVKQLSTEVEMIVSVFWSRNVGPVFFQVGRS